MEEDGARSEAWPLGAKDERQGGTKAGTWDKGDRKKEMRFKEPFYLSLIIFLLPQLILNSYFEERKFSWQCLETSGYKSK